jgi:hypothetical protein
MEDAPLLTRDGDGDRRHRSSSARASTSVFRPTFALGVTLACACALAKTNGVGRTIARDWMSGDDARERASANERGKMSAFGSAAALATSGDGTTPFAVVSDPFVTGGGDDDGASEEYSLVRKSQMSSSGDIEVNHREDVEMVPRAAATMVHLTLLTACAELGSLTFAPGAWEDVVGARVTTKSMSNDFLFSQAQEMTQTRCGTFEVDVMLGAGEQFGFYLYPLDNTSDEATVSDIGCLHRGGGRCPKFATPSALEGMEVCTSVIEEGDDIFYNRVFDGKTFTYVYGSCDEGCALKAPSGCPASHMPEVTTLDTGVCTDPAHAGIYNALCAQSCGAGTTDCDASCRAASDAGVSLSCVPGARGADACRCAHVAANATTECTVPGYDCCTCESIIV